MDSRNGHFRVDFCHRGVSVMRSGFKSAVQAAAVYDALVRRMHVPWAVCNFPEGEAPLPPDVDVDGLLLKYGLLSEGEDQVGGVGGGCIACVYVCVCGWNVNRVGQSCALF